MSNFMERASGWSTGKKFAVALVVLPIVIPLLVPSLFFLLVVAAILAPPVGSAAVGYVVLKKIARSIWGEKNVASPSERDYLEMEELEEGDDEDGIAIRYEVADDHRQFHIEAISQPGLSSDADICRYEGSDDRKHHLPEESSKASEFSADRMPFEGKEEQSEYRTDDDIVLISSTLVSGDMASPVSDVLLVEEITVINPVHVEDQAEVDKPSAENIQANATFADASADTEANADAQTKNEEDEARTADVHVDTQRKEANVGPAYKSAEILVGAGGTGEDNVRAAAEDTDADLQNEEYNVGSEDADREKEESYVGPADKDVSTQIETGSGTLNADAGDCGHADDCLSSVGVCDATSTHEVDVCCELDDVCCGNGLPAEVKAGEEKMGDPPTSRADTDGVGLADECLSSDGVCQVVSSVATQAMTPLDDNCEDFEIVVDAVEGVPETHFSELPVSTGVSDSVLVMEETADLQNKDSVLAAPLRCTDSTEQKPSVHFEGEGEGEGEGVAGEGEGESEGENEVEGEVGRASLEGSDYVSICEELAEESSSDEDGFRSVGASEDHPQQSISSSSSSLSRNEVIAGREVLLQVVRDIGELKKVVGYYEDEEEEGDVIVDVDVGDQVEMLYDYLGVQLPASYENSNDIMRWIEALDVLKAVVGVK